ncbi:Hypothetical protein POVR1_LOCUS367 [uncultured virus]|nr:Hypothetical protein POVR1_LOCUS367 [uncultured virus]
MNHLEIQLPLNDQADSTEVLKIIGILVLPGTVLSIVLGLPFGTVGYLSGGLLGLTVGTIILKCWSVTSQQPSMSVVN